MFATHFANSLSQPNQRISSKRVIQQPHPFVRLQCVIAVLAGLMLLCLSGGVSKVAAQNQNALQDVFLVPYYRSQTTTPLFDTVISITNVNDANCPVTIIWKANSSEEQCRTESIIPANQTHHHCSSRNPEDSRLTMRCHMTCPLTANSIEGHAIIQTSGTCGVRIGVDAKMYSATFSRNVDGRIISTQTIGLHDINVYRFDGVNLTD